MDAEALREAAKIADPLERVRVLERLMTDNAALTVEAARYRRDAVAEAQASGVTSAQTAARARLPGPAQAPRVLVRRALPTDPAVRGSASLYLAEAQRQGIRAGREMLYTGLEPASERIATCLRVQAGDDVVARRKLMTANDVPVRVATSFFRADLFGDTRLAEPGFVRPTLQSALADLGYQFGRAEENLTARRPAPFERRTLDLEPDEWVVQIIRVSYSTEGTPVHVLETICAATHHVFPVGQAAGADEF